MLAGNAIDIGNIVRRRRTQAQLSQGELADRVGVSRKWIADLERGHPRAQLQLVLDVLNALDALVDVIDAPIAESAVGTTGRAGLAPASGRQDLRGATEGFAALSTAFSAAMDSMPKVSMPPELAQSLARVAKNMQLQPETQRAIENTLRLRVIDLDQIAAIRNALAHVHLDENTLKAIRHASKELTLAEADWPGTTRRIGSSDTEGQDAS